MNNRKRKPQYGVYRDWNGDYILVEIKSGNSQYFMACFREAVWESVTGIVIAQNVCPGGWRLQETETIPITIKVARTQRAKKPRAK